MLLIKDIKVGVTIRAIITKYDLIKGHVYEIVRIDEHFDSFNYKDLTDTDRPDDYAGMNSNDNSDLALFELNRITNWKERII